MSRWSTDWFSPHAGQWRSRSLAGARPGRGGPIVLLFLGGLLAFILFAPVWHKVAISWDQPAGQVQLAQVWTKALHDLHFKPAVARLTSFDATWEADGSLGSLQFTVDTSENVEIIVYAQRPAGAGTMHLLAGKYEHMAALSSLEGSMPDPGQVFLSLDQVGIDGLAAATNTTLGANEVFQLDFDAGTSVAPLIPDTPLFAVSGGQVSSLASSAAVSSLAPSLGFSLRRVETAGRKAKYYAGCFFVR